MTAAMQIGDERGMVPTVDMVFFEFIPKRVYDEEGLRSKERLLLSEIRKNEEYVIAMTTTGGIYSYILGDVVCFYSVDPPRFGVVGRTKREINLSAEKMQEQHIVFAMEYAQQKSKALVNEFLLTAKSNPSPRYIVGVEPITIPASLIPA